MKKIITGIHHFFSRIPAHTKQRLNTDVLANLELAHAFNHDIYLEFRHKTGTLTSFIASISSITERQAVVKDITSQQIRIILLSQIKNVKFVTEHPDIAQKNA